MFVNVSLLTSPEEELKRRNAIDKLKKVHNSESDIDALCVGPYFVIIAEDFFIVLYNMLVSRPEVSDIHYVKGAKVPLMRFKFDGISIDLPYARLKVISIPEDVDVFNPLFLKNIDDTSWKAEGYGLSSLAFSLKST
nr:nuclear poly(A) polymerase 3-like [Nicotiana tomentosiformis]